MICKTISTYFTGTKQTSRKSHGLSFAHFWTYYILTCSNNKEKIPNTVAPCCHRRGAVGYNHHSSTRTHYANQNLRIIQKLGEKPNFYVHFILMGFKKKNEIFILVGNYFLHFGQSMLVCNTSIFEYHLVFKLIV